MNGLAGTATALAIIPTGSGNDLARALNLPLDANLAAEVAFAGRIRAVDLGRVAGRHFVTAASFGLDSAANRIANRQKWLTGTPLYIYSMLRAMLEYREPEVTVESDGGEFRGRMLVLAVANGPSYGGGMRIAPAAEIADGWLDVCAVRAMSRLKLLRCFPEVFRGTHLRHAEVQCFRAARVRITASRPLDIFADGEFVAVTAAATPAVVEVVPAALRIVTC